MKQFEINATIEGFSRIDFDKRKIRKALSLEGRAVQKLARRAVSRKAISMPGQDPGKLTGALSRSIKVKVSKPGFLVRIAPYKTDDMRMFYPAILFHGSKKNNIAPRNNYMTEALDARKNTARAAIRHALENALIPRK